MSSTPEYPGTSPGPARCSLTSKNAALENAVVRCGWVRDGERMGGCSIENLRTGQTVSLAAPSLLRITLGRGESIDFNARLQVSWRQGNPAPIAP